MREPRTGYLALTARECRRGEQETLAGFTSALGRGLPEDIHDFVQSQLGRVFDSISSLQRTIADLEDEER